MNLFPTSARTTCVTGVVTVFESSLIGAINGVISPVIGQPVFFTQVVGPAGGMVSLNDLNGQFAQVCGTFTVQNGRPVLNVTFAAPASGTIPTQQTVPVQTPLIGGTVGTQQGLLLALLLQLLQLGRIR